MQKVVKFGGSSLADSNQFKKVKNIIEQDPTRRIVVVSALGKRNKEDHKITDLLYLTGAHLKYGVNASSVFEIVKSRYLEVKNNLSKTYSIGDKVKIPTYKASDNLGYYTVDVLLILPDYQERLLIKDNNGEVTSYLTSDANIYNSSFIYNKNT